MTVGTGLAATSAKSFGVNVIPIESISAARQAVKYSVENHAKDCGLLRAMAVNRTVQKGKRLVATSAVLRYRSKALEPNDSFFLSPGLSGVSLASADKASYGKGSEREPNIRRDA